MAFLIKEKVRIDDDLLAWHFAVAYSFYLITLLVLYMEPEWDCLDLLNAASQRMDMVPAAKRVFNADGNYLRP